MSNFTNVIKKAIIRLLCIVFGENGQAWLESESMIAKLKRGYFHEKEIELLKSFVSAGDTCLDVGANFGQWTFWMSRQVGFSGKVISIEPMPITARVLRKVVARLSLPNVDIHEIAMGNYDGPTMVTVFEDKYKTKFLSVTRLSLDDKIAKSGVKVKMLTLDSFMKSYNSTLRLIKCDIEGAELLFFQEGCSVLKKDKPIIICEIQCEHAESYGYKTKALFDFLGSLGYRSFKYCSGKLVAVINSDDSEINYIFIHKNDKSAFVSVS